MLWEQDAMGARCYGSKMLWEQDAMGARCYGSKMLWEQDAPTITPDNKNNYNARPSKI
ncbi:hypothetical protein CYANOKiyG1_12390 [Okeania sp. KiyG1]|nr:hypothetical protein CYANOKiyG1_12390 [Okeania sp. KiyG1]